MTLGRGSGARGLSYALYPVTGSDSARNAEHCAVVRDVRQYQAVCSYLNVVADPRLREGFRSRREVHIVSENAGDDACPFHGEIGADIGVWADQESVRATDDESRADTGTRRD